MLTTHDMLATHMTPNSHSQKGMATCLTSRRMFAITLMTTLALTAVARPMFAAEGDAADLVPGEPRVVGALPRGVTPGPTGSILDSARRQLSRQVASRAEQDRGATAKPDSLWNGTLIGSHRRRGLRGMEWSAARSQ